jgi:hypothetical protein
VFVDVDAVFCIARNQFVPVRSAPSRNAVEAHPVWSHESEGAVVQALHEHAALVYLAVMEAA